MHSLRRSPARSTTPLAGGCDSVRLWTWTIPLPGGTGCGLLVSTPDPTSALIHHRSPSAPNSCAGSLCLRYATAPRALAVVKRERETVYTQGAIRGPRRRGGKERPWTILVTLQGVTGEAVHRENSHLECHSPACHNVRPRMPREWGPSPRNTLEKRRLGAPGAPPPSPRWSLPPADPLGWGQRPPPTPAGMGASGLSPTPRAGDQGGFPRPPGLGGQGVGGQECPPPPIVVGVHVDEAKAPLKNKIAWLALSGGMSGDDIRDPHLLPSDVADEEGPLE